MDRKTHIAGIRALADFLETHPEMPLPNNLGPDFYAYVSSKEQLSPLLRQASFVKHPSAVYFDFVHQVAPEFFYQLSILRRELCEPVIVGTRKVRKLVLLPPEKEHVADMVDEPIYEWQCPDSILKLTQD